MKDRCKCGAWSCLDHESCPKCGREVAVHGCEKCGASVMTRDDVCCGCSTPNPRFGSRFREHLIKEIDDSVNSETLIKAQTPRTDALQNSWARNPPIWELARELERELAELKQKIDALT